jgi:rRNA biogenesis protein RRP5
VCGFFEGTVDLAHVDAGGEDLEEKYKIGKKVSI